MNCVLNKIYTVLNTNTSDVDEYRKCAKWKLNIFESIKKLKDKMCLGPSYIRDLLEYKVYHDNDNELLFCFHWLLPYDKMNFNCKMIYLI